MPLVKTSNDPTRGEDHEDKIVDDAVGEQQERIAAIVKAIDELKAGTSDYTGGGLPNVEALEVATGFPNITGAERDQAWEIYNG